MNYQHSRKVDIFTEELTEEEIKQKSVIPTLMDSLEINTPHNLTEAQLEEAKFRINSAHCTLYGRDLINIRGSEANPQFMEEEIHSLIDGKKGVASINVIRGKELEHKGMNLFYNVGKSATSEPRLITVHYNGNPESKDIQYVIVGKGLTYDTGGLNLKPTGYMEDMYCDKGGAVAAIGAMKGVIEMQLPINAVFAFGIAENAIDAKSYKPGDILTSLKGYTVSIGNTDAEGRLVLADTMTWVQKEFKPKYLIDLATLTGAAKVALGNHIAGKQALLSSV
jgi:leucyl aminopeptidase